MGIGVGVSANFPLGLVRKKDPHKSQNSFMKCKEHNVFGRLVVSFWKTNPSGNLPGVGVGVDVGVCESVFTTQYVKLSYYTFSTHKLAGLWRSCVRCRGIVSSQHIFHGC